MKNNKKILIIPIFVVILLIAISIPFFNRNEKTKNEYKWKTIDSVDLPEGLYKSKLERPNNDDRCLNDVCVDDVVIVFNQTSGSVNYKLINNSEKKLKDVYYFLKLSNDDKLLIYVSKLNKGESYQGRIFFNGKNMYNVNSYKLISLTKEELKSVK